MKDNRKKVWVVVLNQGTTSTGLEIQLYQWMKALDKDYNFLFHPSKYAGRPIASNRNEIVRDFLRSDSDYLVMVDDDNPPNGNFLELLKLDRDVIGVPTPGRNDKGLFWMVYSFMEGYPDNIILEAFPFDKREGVQKVDAISTGCIIVARRVLEKIEKPFEDIYDEEGVIVHSDDIGFAHKVKQAGFQEYAAFEFNCSHYKTVDLLQMIAFSNIMYENGYKAGLKAAQGIKPIPVKLSDVIKEVKKNANNPRQIKKA